MKLNKEEKDILNAYEKSNSPSIPNIKKEMGKYRQYAKQTLKKTKNIKLRRNK